MNDVQVDLTGFYDLHIHTSPDVRPREVDDFTAAKQALDSGMACIGLKSHVTMTCDRAALVQKVVPGINVVGSIVLNEQVGGLNPAAVETAIQLGAQIVWMPTISAKNHLAYHGQNGGIYLFEEKKTSALLEIILSQIAEANIILATGHISVTEMIELVKRAKRVGIKKIIITHPEVPWIDMPVDIQRDLSAAGVFFERCYISTMAVGGGVPMNRIIEDIRGVGVDTTILSTDCGAAGYGIPVDGLRAYISKLLLAGFNQQEINRMAQINPASLIA